MKKIYNYLKTKPPMIIAISFLLLIFVGSFLLRLPISQKEEINYLDCLFTATSAVCVTGLVTVPVFTSWTVFGKLVIIILIQMGGLGFMTFTTLMAIILKKKITLRERIIIREQTNSEGLSGMVRLIKYILICTFTIETIGALMLMVRFIPQFGLAGIAISFFHSISAFCNAGFDTLGPNSLISYNHDAYLLFVLGSLIFLGGLGFVVYSDIYNNRFKGRKLHLHTKVVLATTFFLIVLSTISFYYLEGTNPYTLKGYRPFDKLSNALFQAITLRTAGFAAIDQSLIRDASSAIGVINMFIGGSPAGTAGGIKTTTFAILVIIAISEIKQRDDIEIFQRRVNFKIVRRAITLIMLGLAWVSVVSIIILTITNFDFVDVIYEVTSAFGTVGLSRNLTPRLDDISKILIIITMYIGRAGLMTVIAALNSNNKKKLYREAEEGIIIG
ncbi:MAG: TrkH family potassium uptake protein [Peptoniphilaceae bacterium]|nr:TrkH family potassium uptake protein [Peptoniphilaceae bacterium]MDY6019365.1 TrkH family potassium uptake protein [Anaerococcus sp.]